MCLHGGRYKVLEDILCGAVPLLWDEYRKKGISVLRRDEFFRRYHKCCRHLLSGVIQEWFEDYGGEGAYKDFYAKKLELVARCSMPGGKGDEAIRSMQIKPAVRRYFSYKNNAWYDLDE